MEPSEFEKLARDAFPTLERVILYGLGEPLMHTKFLSLLEMSRQYLPEHARIEFTTNGSLLAPAYLDAMRPYKLHRIIVSLDSPSIQKNRSLRQGFSPEVMDNIRYLCQSHRAGHPREIAIETVVSQSNLQDLSRLVQYCHDIGMPKLFVSHLYPYTEAMESLALYVPVSQRAFEVLMSIAASGWETLSPSQLLPLYTNSINTKTHPSVQYMRQQLDKVHDEGVDIDLQKLASLSQRVAQIRETQKVFADAKRLAEKLGIQLGLPSLFVNPDKRQCPFIAQQALFITADGTVAPCYNLAHTHSLYINRHLRQEFSYPLGTIFQASPLASICASHTALLSRLQSFRENIPWCGGCTYSTQNCFHGANNESDCYGNQPACNNCLYSTGFVKCLFD
jgi:MoaA/NifB/PqqE/SkfB family radical SAM enzyme